jgi:hypothetical protein
MRKFDRIDVRDVDAEEARMDRRMIFYAIIFGIALIVLGGLIARYKILEFISSF